MPTDSEGVEAEPAPRVPLNLKQAEAMLIQQALEQAGWLNTRSTVSRWRALLEDSPDRSVVVYLPPNYDENPVASCGGIVYLRAGWNRRATKGHKGTKAQSKQ